MNIRATYPLHGLLPVLSLAAVLLLTACPSGPEAASGGADDSALNLLPIHEHTWMLRETGILNLSTRYSSYYLESGWTHPYDPETGESARVIAWDKEAVLRYNVLLPHHRWLIFTAATEDRRNGPRYQKLTILAGERELGTFEFEAEPQEFQVFIPKEVQSVGENRLTFRFSFLQQNEDFVYKSRKRHERFPFPSVAATFWDFKVKLGNEEEPMLYETPDESEAFQMVANGQFLSQQVRSQTSYAFKIGKDAKLGFSGSVETVTGDPEEVRIGISLRGNGEQEYQSAWSEEIVLGPATTSESFEGSLDLSAWSGKHLEIRLAAHSPQVVPRTRVIWRSLELDMKDMEEKRRDTDTATAVAPIKNVIIIVLDAARTEDFGVYGSDLGATPNIDAFAEDALVFDNATVTAPYTITSISSLFTGLLPEAHGVRKVNQALPDTFETMAKAFQRTGYYAVSLSGTQFLMPTHGLTDEFDKVVYLRTDEAKNRSDTTMSAARMQEGVSAAKESGKPVFLYAHFLPPHWPYRPPQDFVGFYTSGEKVTLRKAWMVKTLLDFDEIQSDHPDIQTYARRYYDNLRYGDHLVAQLMDMLKEAGLYEDSIVIVTSDHGESLGEHEEFGHNTSVYEEMIRVPLIVKVPGVEPRRIKQTVGLIDLFPTFTELIGLRSEPVVWQGRSLAPLLSGNDQPSGGPYYARTFHHSDLYFMMRGDRFKFVNKNWGMQLFDLQEHPDETRSFVQQFRATTLSLRQLGLMTIAANAAINNTGGLEVDLTEEERDELRDLGYIQ